MYLYLLSQDENTGYDTYDAIVVAAESEEEARNIHPYLDGWNPKYQYNGNGAWASSPDKVKVERIGVAMSPVVEKAGVILASFNAG